jgi:DNA-binding transcriptional regulator YhcF (GntR family)
MKLNVPINEIIQKYQELKTLTKTAKFYNVNIETIRILFKKNNITYTKQLVYDVDHDFFRRDTPETFYWAGFLAADRNIDSTKPRISLKLASKDISHLEKYKISLKTNAPIVNSIRSDERIEFKKEFYYQSAVRFTSRQIVKDLKNFNIVPAKSLTYTFPTHLENNPNIRYFIAGLIDGDGSIFQENNSSRISLYGTKHCVESAFNHLIKKLNIYPSQLQERKPTLYAQSCSNLEDNIKIIHYIYDGCPVFLDRKKAAADIILNQKPRKIEVTKEELELLLDKYKQFQNVEKFKLMAADLHMSTIVLRRRLKEFGLFKKQIIENKLIEILGPTRLKEEFELLGSVRLIAEKYNLADLTVQRALNKLNIDWRINEHLTISKVDLQEIYNKLGSIRKIAKELGVDKTKVKYRMDKFGIPYNKTPRNQFGDFKKKKL